MWLDNILVISPFIKRGKESKVELSLAFFCVTKWSI